MGLGCRQMHDNFLNRERGAKIQKDGGIILFSCIPSGFWIRRLLCLPPPCEQFALSPLSESLSRSVVTLDGAFADIPWTVFALKMTCRFRHCIPFAFVQCLLPPLFGIPQLFVVKILNVLNLANSNCSVVFFGASDGGGRGVEDAKIRPFCDGLHQKI